MDVFQNLLLRKRKTQEDEISDILFKRRKTSNYHMQQAITAVACAASGLLQTNTRKPRSADKTRDSGWWENGLLNWGECEFKQRLRAIRETFNIILDHNREDIKKQPTNLKPFSTTPEQQLGLTLYRLAHGCSFSTVAGFFRVSISLAEQTFNKVAPVLVARMCDTFVVSSKNQAEWETELKNFIENYLRVSLRRSVERFP